MDQVKAIYGRTPTLREVAEMDVKLFHMVLCPNLVASTFVRGCVECLRCLLDHTPTMDDPVSCTRFQLPLVFPVDHSTLSPYKLEELVPCKDEIIMCHACSKSLFCANKTERVFNISNFQAE